MFTARRDSATVHLREQRVQRAAPAAAAAAPAGLRAGPGRRGRPQQRVAGLAAAGAAAVVVLRATLVWLDWSELPGVPLLPCPPPAAGELAPPASVRAARAVWAGARAPPRRAPRVQLRGSARGRGARGRVALRAAPRRCGRGVRELVALRLPVRPRGPVGGRVDARATVGAPALGRAPAVTPGAGLSGVVQAGLLPGEAAAGAGRLRAPGGSRRGRRQPGQRARAVAGAAPAAARIPLSRVPSGAALLAALRPLARARAGRRRVKARQGAGTFADRRRGAAPVPVAAFSYGPGPPGPEPLAPALALLRGPQPVVAAPALRLPLVQAPVVPLVLFMVPLVPFMERPVGRRQTLLLQRRQGCAGGGARPPAPRMPGSGSAGGVGCLAVARPLLAPLARVVAGGGVRRGVRRVLARVGRRRRTRLCRGGRARRLLPPARRGLDGLEVCLETGCALVAHGQTSGALSMLLSTAILRAQRGLMPVKGWAAWEVLGRTATPAHQQALQV